ATITVAITRQQEWLMKKGSEEEKKEANRMFKQFKLYCGPEKIIDICQ
ncbi:5182_t:CDS:2, partial [Acaulospora colombiana]